VETVDVPPDRVKEPTHRAGHDTHCIKQQGIVGRMMDISLHNRGVGPELLTILQLHLNGGLNDEIIDTPQCFGRQAVESFIERLMLRYRLAVEVRELTQGDSVGDAFTQLTQVPVFDAPENQRAQDLLRRQSTATRAKVLQSSLQIVLYSFDDCGIVVEEVRNRL